MALFANNILIGSSGVSDYEIERSLRFDRVAGAYLSRSVSYTPTSTKIATWSFWVKRCNDTGEHNFFGSKNSGGSGATGLRFVVAGDGNYINFFAKNTSNNWVWNMRTTQVFRDYSAWYHVVAALDTTQGSSTNRIKLYVNGVQITDFGTATYPAEDAVIQRWGQSGETETIGSEGTAECFDGYMSEINYIDGQQLTPSSFGETNADTGQWIAKKYAGTYGNGGFFLKFLDNSGTTASTLGKDSSGNGGNFTPNNFSVTAGKDDDSMLDTPTNNFPTLNPFDRSRTYGTMSNGNLRISYNYKPASYTWRASMALPATGKFYWEWENEETSSNPGRWNTGLVRYTSERQTYNFQAYNDVDYVSTTYGGSFWAGTTNISDPGNGWSSWPTFYSGERMAYAVNMTNGKYWVGKVASNGSTTWYAADGGTDGDPAAGTNEMGTLPNNGTGQWIPYVGWHDGGGAVTATFTSNINFGQHSFLGTAPTGFDKLCSANLSTPTIKNGSDHFNTLTYTGNDSDDRDITGVGFQPDFLWIKNRSQTDWHMLQDSVRGANKVVYSNTNDSESTDNSNGHVNSFLADGFNVTAGASGNVNENGENYVAWNWKGGSTVTNDSGSVDSQVNANTSAGFSIVTWTGTSGADTIGHGLGVAPELIIVKKRSTSDNWLVYSSASGASMGATKQMYLDLVNAVETNANIFNVVPTSSLFTVGSWSGTATMLAYCFASVEGYSKIGAYAGNGNADGIFVYTGFKPAYIMIKSTSAEAWNVFDDVRDTDNYVHHLLKPDANTEENNSTTARRLDFLSNGFKLRGTDGTINDTLTYVYMAFAETPFKYATAR